MFNRKMDEFADSFHAETGFSGVLRVTVKDEIIYKRNVGLANRETGEEFTENSMFSFYSLSKPFCAIGLMKLYDRGLVNLDDHPAKYLPECENFNKSLRIRHLMNHTSGCPDCYIETEFAAAHCPANPAKLREHISLISKYPQYFEPGTAAKYANINYNIMAMIIENVSGLSYGEYMAKEVFMPLSMPHAVADSPRLYIPNRVQGYELRDGKIMPVDRNTDWMTGAGDIVGTADDVYCLNLAIKNKLLLSKDSWRQILTPSPLNSMGFGCTVKVYDGKVRITHNGGHTGFRTYHIQFPSEDLDIILLSNSGWGLGRNAFETAIYENYFGYDITRGFQTPMDTGYI